MAVDGDMGPASSRDPAEESSQGGGQGREREDSVDEDDDHQRFKEELYARAAALAAFPRRDTVSRLLLDRTDRRHYRRADLRPPADQRPQAGRRTESHCLGKCSEAAPRLGPGQPRACASPRWAVGWTQNHNVHLICMSTHASVRRCTLPEAEVPAESLCEARSVRRGPRAGLAGAGRRLRGGCTWLGVPDAGRGEGPPARRQHATSSRGSKTTAMAVA